MAPRAQACPRCGASGQSVQASTLEHLTDPRGDVGALGDPWFCRTQGCEIVYFDESGSMIPKQALRVRVFQKETDPERPVCYCFGHSVGDVLAARVAGDNEIVQAITMACRRGLDRCEETNPQGRCCLGNVRAVAKVAPPGEASPPCCSSTS